MSLRPVTPGRASPRLRAELLDGEDDPRWRSLLDRADANLFHLPQWNEVLRDTYDFETYAAVSVDAHDDPLGGVAWSLVPGLTTPRLAVSPYADTRGPLLLDDRAWDPLFELLCSHDLPVTMRCLDGSAATRDPRLQVTSLARWHGIHLSRDEDELFDGFSASNRRAIRKAQRAGITIEPMDDDEFIDTFLAMHVGVRKRKFGLLAQPRSFLDNMAKRFREIDGWFPLVALRDGRPIAATLYLRDRDVLYYKFNASLSEALEHRPNNLLLWAGVTLGRSLGCGLLDLGASDDDEPGLIRFKRSFAPEEREITRLRYDPPGLDADADRASSCLLGDLTRLFTDERVPDDVTAEAGALLYRYFA